MYAGFAGCLIVMPPPSLSSSAYEREATVFRLPDVEGDLSLPSFGGALKALMGARSGAGASTGALCLQHL